MYSLFVIVSFYVKGLAVCKCFISSDDDACHVCCSQPGSEECLPLGDTVTDLSDGVPCLVNGRCLNVSVCV